MAVMGGKHLTLAALVLCLVVIVQTQVADAGIICCTSLSRRKMYDTCNFVGVLTKDQCMSLAGCIEVNGACPPGYPEVAEEGRDALLEFCRLGCTSTVCHHDMISKFAAGEEILNGAAMGRCNDACDRFCAKRAETEAASA